MPVTVTTLETGPVLDVTTVSVEVTPLPLAVGVTDVGYGVQVTPAGQVADRATLLMKPLEGVTVIVAVALPPLVTVEGLKGVKEMLKSWPTTH